jgi:hypothetical protein
VLNVRDEVLLLEMHLVPFLLRLGSRKPLHFAELSHRHLERNHKQTGTPAGAERRKWGDVVGARRLREEENSKKKERETH